MFKYFLLPKKAVRNYILRNCNRFDIKKGVFPNVEHLSYNDCRRINGGCFQDMYADAYTEDEYLELLGKANSGTAFKLDDYYLRIVEKDESSDASRIVELDERQLREFVCAHIPTDELLNLYEQIMTRKQ